jgi:hypothetical protein
MVNDSRARRVENQSKKAFREALAPWRGRVFLAFRSVLSHHQV